MSGITADHDIGEILKDSCGEQSGCAQEFIERSGDPGYSERNYKELQMPGQWHRKR